MTEERRVGRYVLSDEIAAGGMATVHLGRLEGPVGFARIVAIKRLHPHFAKDPEFVAMLLDEARLAGRIRHPNVIATTDVVVERGEMLLVMDYVQGESLSRLVRAVTAAQGQIPLGIVLSVIASALYGLHAAHEATNDNGVSLNIVHRDVSPQNIMVGIDGIARVLDFGVAKAAGRIQTTHEGMLKGKVGYMSPEQINGDEIDRRSDVYAAAVVLWEALCLRRLFQGENEIATVHRVLQGKVPPPHELRPDLPRVLDAIVMKGLAPNAADRFQTAHDMAEALHKVAQATPGEIAAWVRAHAGTALAERAARIAEIESSSGTDRTDTDVQGPRKPRATRRIVAALAQEQAAIAGTTQPVPALPVGTVVTDLSAATPAATPAIKPPANGLRRARAVVAVVAVAASAVVGLVIRAAIVRDSPGSPSSSVVVQPPPPPSVSASLPPSAAPAAPQSASSSPVATVAPTRRTTSPRPTAHPKCVPPFTLDENGIRVPKPECL